MEGVDEARKNNILPIRGTKELITNLNKSKFKLAIASYSPLEFIELVVHTLGLKDVFDSITSTDEVKRGKPGPDVFILAAKRISCKPEECIVIEDSLNGIIAAKKAGMKCIGFVADKGKNYPADLLVTDIRNISIEKIRNM